MSRASTGLSAEKIAFKLRELQNKLEIEQRLKAGFDRLYNTFANRDNLTKKEMKTRDEAGEKFQDAKLRIHLLKTALQRYQGMHVEGLADTSGQCFVRCQSLY
jgi:hypothetical protein